MPHEVREKKIKELQDRIRSLVNYWDTVKAPNLKTQRDRLEGLAFSICNALDESFAVIDLEDGKTDLAGGLHESLWSS